MIKRWIGAALAAAAVCLWGGAAFAQYVAVDGNGAKQTFCSTIVSSTEYPCHLNYGLFSGSPKAWAMDTNGYGGVNVQNTVAVTGTFWQSTQPVSLASVPLPSGASTAANQTAVQAAAGSSSSSVLGVQGVAGGLAVPVSAASLPLPSGAATSANQTNASQKTQIVDGSGSVIASTSNALNVNDATVVSAINGAALTSLQLHILGTPETADSGNVANATATATLAAASGKTTYITDFMCTASGATSAKVVTVTLTGVITGTKNFTFVFPAGVTTAATPLVFTPPQPIPASATNTTIAVTMPSSGSGGTNATCTADGLQL